MIRRLEKWRDCAMMFRHMCYLFIYLLKIEMLMDTCVFEGGIITQEQYSLGVVELQYCTRTFISPRAANTFEVPYSVIRFLIVLQTKASLRTVLQKTKYLRFVFMSLFSNEPNTNTDICTHCT